MNSLAKYLMIPVVAAGLMLTGCNDTNKAYEASFNGNTYSVADGNIIQTQGSVKSDGTTKFGVVSDLEGDMMGVLNSVAKIKKVKGLDGIIIAGDCYENENIRRNPLFPNSTDNKNEMKSAIEKYAAVGVPVYVIAGNHENQSVYNDAIKELQEKGWVNVFDINDKYVDLDGVNIIGLGGYHHEGFMPSDGFKINLDDVDRFYSQFNDLKSQNEPTLMITHSPPLTNNSKIDQLYNSNKHVGDKAITAILSDVDSGINNVSNYHGHIHEGGNNSVGFPAGTSTNVASITRYMSQNGGGNVILATVGEDGVVSNSILQ